MQARLVRTTTPFQVMCRFYVSSLCLIALIIPLVSDPAIRHRLATGITTAAAYRDTNPRFLIKDLERNRVRLTKDISGLTHRSSNVSFIVIGAAAKHRVDPALVKAVLHVESKALKGGISAKGARGFMQLMPSTARRLGVSDIHDPVQNIYGGAKYLRHLLDMYNNDVRLALAAYNAGPGKVRQYNGVPPFRETRSYIDKVMTAYRGYRQIYS